MFYAFNQLIFQPLIHILSYKIHIYEFSFSIFDIIYYGFWCVMFGLLIKCITGWGK